MPVAPGQGAERSGYTGAWVYILISPLHPLLGMWYVFLNLTTDLTVSTPSDRVVVVTEECRCYQSVCVSVSQGGTGNLSHVTPNTSLGFVQATPSRVLPSPTVNTREALGERPPLAAIRGHTHFPFSLVSTYFTPVQMLCVSSVWSDSGFVSSRCDHGHVPSADPPRRPV